MDLATMRTRFKTRLSGMADDESDADINGYLNAARRYLIPDRVAGFLTNGTETIQVNDAQKVYTLGDHVHSVYDEGAVFYDGTKLTLYYAESLFYAAVGGVTEWTNSSGTPTDILISGVGGSLTATFYPNSDQVAPAYDSVLIFTREYPSADLTDDGAEYYVYASAVVSGGAMEYARDVSEDELFAKEKGRFDECIGMMQSRSLSHPRPTRWQPTF